ncbi:glycosyltransferase [Defluviimonas salinarum]|uniref:Glycosyltransferase n=1 Tax=Defluviimonas salinarum TaxID=2992147 RepID=A0ABT3J0S7_9RHOB|nr:glycosyltransferase [Defluviimonas salinarum]MCW3781292.1 glycosyltransferase [Defluviimonas salinarum]
MSSAAPHLRLVTPGPVPAPVPGGFARRADRAARIGRKPLGQILLDMRAVDPGNLLKAIALRDRQALRLGDVLLAHSWVGEAELMAALGLQWGSKVVDLRAEPPDPRLIDRLGCDTCLAEVALPWRRIGGATVIVTARPEEFAALRARLPKGFGPVVMALAPEQGIHEAILAARRSSMVHRAETRTPAAESCRAQDGTVIARAAAAVLAALACGTLAAPAATFALLTLWAVISLASGTGLKLACFLSEYRARPAPLPASRPGPERLPVVSVMVPLFRENDIAPRIIRRIGRIDYPKELLDILLVVEEDDHQTQEALAQRDLPRWMRVIVVPNGTVRTKPRALNYALDFCRGAIVGVWDAEDAPEPGQIRKVVRGFHDHGPEVACLQGILDFYDVRHNWLTRCFTIEYAAWFRAVLPGLARLGFVVPLGGTTLFFRREAIETLGGWDAHNVTEDADLGLRLARRGYRTEMIDAVTEEEPNARVRTWIRQRSRWQKGYAMTWASHMRDPARLWRDLGARRFWGVQILFLGSLSHSLMAPVLWSFWLLTLGRSHAFAGAWPVGLTAALIALFVAAEGVNLAVGVWATRGPGHRHLMKWVPTLQLYYPLGTLSAFKGLYEWVARPFFWDKTAHGVLAAGADVPELQPILVLTRPVHLPATDAEAVPLGPRSGTLAMTKARITLSVAAGCGDEPAKRPVPPPPALVASASGARPS